MDRRTTGIVATVVAVLLCGCPGLFSLCFGAMFALVSQIPGADIDMYGSNDPAQALTFGVGGICVGIVLVIIPIIVGFLMLRNRTAALPPANPGEPLPPAI
jgi:hypothetical protein